MPCPTSSCCGGMQLSASAVHCKLMHARHTWLMMASDSDWTVGSRCRQVLIAYKPRQSLQMTDSSCWGCCAWLQCTATSVHPWDWTRSSSRACWTFITRLPTLFCSASSYPALPCAVLPCPALPCPLPCPAPPCPAPIHTCSYLC